MRIGLIDIEDVEYKCTICGLKYPAIKMFNRDTCNGCQGLHLDISFRDGRHEKVKECNSGTVEQ